MGSLLSLMCRDVVIFKPGWAPAVLSPAESVQSGNLGARCSLACFWQSYTCIVGRKSGSDTFLLAFRLLVYMKVFLVIYCWRPASFLPSSVLQHGHAFARLDPFLHPLFFCLSLHHLSTCFSALHTSLSLSWCLHFKSFLKTGICPHLCLFS